MKRKSVARTKLESLCGEIHPDDGMDPAQFFRPARKSGKNDRKDQQLCHQVAETLNLVLSGEYGDELRDVRIVSVTPAPDASQLMVMVAPAISGDQVNPGAVIAKLTSAAGRLRAEVAASITRRRAPNLLFQFVAESVDRKSNRDA